MYIYETSMIANLPVFFDVMFIYKIKMIIINKNNINKNPLT